MEPALRRCHSSNARFIERWAQAVDGWGQLGVEAVSNWVQVFCRIAQFRRRSVVGPASRAQAEARGSLHDSQELRVSKLGGVLELFGAHLEPPGRDACGPLQLSATVRLRAPVACRVRGAWPQAVHLDPVCGKPFDDVLSSGLRRGCCGPYKLGSGEQVLGEM